MTKKITLPITDEDIKNLKAGDSVLLTGTILTGRDAAHKRLYELIEQGKELPIDVKGELIYYVGPAPAKEYLIPFGYTRPLAYTFTVKTVE